MRLIHYYPRALVGDGGPTRAMWEWASAACRAGCPVTVVYDADLEAESPLRDPAVPIVPLKHAGAGLVRMPRRLADVLAAGDVVILHSTYVPANVAAAWSARRRGVPYIVMPHGGYNQRARERRHRRKHAWRPVERAYLEASLAIHVFFDIESRDVAEVAPNARWLIAPTGFDVPAGRWDGGSGGYLAWIGRYDVRTKGLDLLIQALRWLPAGIRRPLRLHGRRSEDSAGDIEKIAQAEGIAEDVSVGGHVTGSDKADFLRRAAAYVHPSRWESYGLSIVEALAYGVPTVASVSCSIAGTLRAADAAVIVDPTPEGIADGISTVLRHQEHYSERALAFVRTSLAWDVIVKDYLQQVESLLAGRNRPPAPH
jgi:glycosyltransferase involved in cell wall biosynthesis